MSVSPNVYVNRDSIMLVSVDAFVSSVLGKRQKLRPYITEYSLPPSFTEDDSSNKDVNMLNVM